MFDLSQPIQIPVIIGSIVLILVLVGIGLLSVQYFKRKISQ